MNARRSGIRRAAECADREFDEARGRYQLRRHAVDQVLRDDRAGPEAARGALPRLLGPAVGRRLPGHSPPSI